MKLIVTVVRPERLTAVKEALFRVGVTGMTLSRVSGHGGEREVVEHYRGSSVVLEFRDKVRIEMAVSEPFVESTVERSRRGAHRRRWATARSSSSRSITWFAFGPASG